MPNRNPYGLTQDMISGGQTYDRHMAEALPFIMDILSGKGRISSRMAETIMQNMTPEMLRAYEIEGQTIDPLWFQNYIQPGTVAPSTWGAIQDYVNRMGDSAFRDSVAGVADQYSLPNTLTDWERMQHTRGPLNQAMARHGMEYNPVQRQYQLSGQAAAGFGLDQLAGAASRHHVPAEGSSWVWRLWDTVNPMTQGRNMLGVAKHGIPAIAGTIGDAISGNLTTIQPNARKSEEEIRSLAQTLSDEDLTRILQMRRTQGGY